MSYSSLDTEKQNSFFVYKNLEMYMNGNESSLGQDWYDNCNGIDSEECSNVELCFRFGKDENYYEIRKPFKSIDNESVTDPNGWQNLKIDLDELTRYKLNRQNLESYVDNGIDNCDDLYETGIIDTQTNIPNIYVVGDASGHISLVNVGELEGRYAVERIFSKKYYLLFLKQ